MYCPTCPNEKCVNLSTRENLVFVAVKSSKLALTCLIILLGIKNDNYFVWWLWYTLICNKDELRLWGRKSISIFWNFSPPITIIKHTKACTKKGKTYYNYVMILLAGDWLVQLTKNSSPFSFYTLSVYSKATWSTQPPTAVLSGLSNLDQIQLLWL